MHSWNSKPPRRIRFSVGKHLFAINVKVSITEGLFRYSIFTLTIYISLLSLSLPNVTLEPLSLVTISNVNATVYF